MVLPYNGSLSQLQWFVQTAMPAIYDDSLSYYELLSKVIQQLNTNTDFTNGVKDTLNALIAQVNSEKWIDNKKLKDQSVDTRVLKDGAVTTGKIDPAIMEQPTTVIGVQAKLQQIDESLVDVNQHVESQSVNVKYPPKNSGLTPLKGDGTDETSAFKAFINYAKTRAPLTLYFPNGTYEVGDVGNLAYKGITYKGATDRGVVFRSNQTTANHTAFLFDAFWEGVRETGFVNKCNVENIIFEGNANTLKTVFIQGIARSNWRNVYSRKTRPDTGSGFYLAGVMLSRFENMMCSTQLDNMGTLIPKYGIYFDSGYRGSGGDVENVGHSSNNTFISCYFEGQPNGGWLAKADQNTFIGGSFESNTVNGVYIYPESMYNTFMGVGFESKDATLDIDDSGLTTQFINCYSSNYVKLRGRGEKISGGLYNNIELMSTSVQCIVENVNVRHWGGSVGLADSGTGNKFKGVYNEGTSAYMYPAKARIGITVGASPFTWTNNTGNMVQVIFGSSGSVTALQSLRNGGDPVNIPVTLPAVLTIAPNDGLTVTYSAAPSMSYRELNGF